MGLELRRVLRGIAFLSVLWPFCSAAIAFDAYNRSGRPQTALEDYDKALALGHLTPNDTYRLRVGVGAAHIKLKNEKGAIEAWIRLSN